MFETLVYALIKVLLVAGALCVAFHPNILYAALALLVTFGAVAAMYVLGGADFLAGAQIIVYVGGILVVVLFAIMLSPQIYNFTLASQLKKTAPAILAGLGLFWAVQHIVDSFPWADFIRPIDATAQASSLRVVGNALLKEYVYPFEAVSLLLLVALVGAMILSRPGTRDKP